MEKKLILIDVDGTLCTHDGSILDSTKTAIKKAHEQGHLLYLCTGRAVAEIVDEIAALGFDGIVASSGGYIEADGKTIKHESISTDDVKDIIQYYHEHKIEYYLECNDGIYGSDRCEEKILEVTSNYFKKDKADEFQWFLDLLKPLDENTLNRIEVNKISFINTTTSFEDLEKQFGEKYELVQSTVISFGEYSGELGIKGISKKNGIEELLEYLNFDKKNTVAIGDGYNDIPMFEACAYTIAMGNATQELKDIADEVTDDVDQNGFYNSFRRNGFISD